MWDDERDYPSTDSDVYLQRVTAAGTIATGWPLSGFPACAIPASQGPQNLLLDGQGGVLLVWYDHRNVALGTSQDIYAQRVQGDGTIAPGWPVGGAPVTRAPGYQALPASCSDGSGGIFVAWEDDRDYGTNSIDIYAQHLTASGDVAPGWPVGGLRVCIDPASQGGTNVVSDGTGGFVVVWADVRRGPIDIYAQHLLADGTIAPGWVTNGVPVIQGRTNSRAVPDGAGGFYVSCSTLDPVYFEDLNYYVQRFTFAGARAAGWPEGGVLVCTAPDTRLGLQASTDGQGGVLMAWYDYRPPSTGGEIYVARVLPDATLSPGWTVNGTPVSDPLGPGYEFLEYDSDLTSDGAGGAYVVWERNTSSPGQPAFIQHLTPQGGVAPGWPAYGVPVSPARYQFDTRLTSDGAGGAIVAWDDGSTQQAVYAQRFVVDGPVAVQVSLVSAEATADLVTLAWLEAGDRTQATLYRSASGGDWTPLTHLDPDGEGFLRYEDRDVSPGTRYGYRLGVVSNDVEKFVGETSIEVPASVRFALRGVSPNPALRDLNVSFSLVGRDRATLDLIDIAGRRVKSQEVGALGAGNHVVNLSRDAVLPAGVYLVALTQGTRSLTTRAVVVH